MTDDERTALPVVDPGTLAELTAGLGADAQAFLDDLVSTWEEQAAALVADLRAGAAAGDAARLRAAAHTLKGSSSALGAVSIVAVCERIERDADANRVGALVERCAALVALAGDEMRRVVAAG